MKIKGEELIRFEREAWPKPEDDWFWDHDLFDEPDPSAIYDTDEIGPIHHQGGSDDPTGGDGYDIAVLIRKWRKTRAYDLYLIEVPKDQSNAFLSATATFNAKVVK